MNRFVEACNVGSLDQVNVVCIAEIVYEKMGIGKPKFRFNKAAVDGRGWRGDVKTMHLSVQKLLDLGWKPTLASEGAVRLSCEELLRC